MSAFGATYGIDDIAELVSPRVAMRLVEAFPGTVRYIPKKIGDDHELLVIGAAEAAALAQQFGGAHITIPMSFITPARRRALIFRLAAENIPRQEIALRAECTERRVYQILHEGPKPPLQSSLKFSD